MPKGLKNASATINRVITLVMCQYRTYAPYSFDDGLAHSRADEGLSKIESHKRHPDAMLKPVGDAKKYANLQKCVIEALVIHVLSCIAGLYDVQTDSEKYRISRNGRSSTCEGPTPIS